MNHPRRRGGRAPGVLSF